VGWLFRTAAENRMDPWHKKALQSLLLPSGLILLSAVVILQTGIVQISTAAVDAFYYLVFIAGILLAWRFQSSNTLSAMVLLLISHRALEFFSNGKVVANGPGRVAFEVIAMLLPLNFLVLSLVPERRLTIPTTATRAIALFFQSTFVAAVCRPGVTKAPGIFHFTLLDKNYVRWTHIAQPALLVFFLTFGFLATRFWTRRKPLDSGLLWATAAIFAGLQVGGIGRLGSAYFATAALILAGSIIENSYLLAYHDELTSLQGRRAFNLALPQLTAPYVVAAVDIDHFKSVNDTYGHDTGDQVLRMVASRLARVSGGGEAYRVGGEEFTVLFPGKTSKEVTSHLEDLRQLIEASSFRLRSMPDRRSAPRETTDRRTDTKGSRKASKKVTQSALTDDGKLSVTVSIGIAECKSQAQKVDQVIEAADQALYQAKKNGRNRIEIAGTSRARTRARAKRATA
jgi:GGDEF domain-containing protein